MKPAVRAAFLVGCMELLTFGDRLGTPCRGRRCLPREADSFPYRITMNGKIYSHANQSGPRQRRSRIATAMNTMANTSPSQRPGELRYAAGVSCGASTECMLKAKAF